MFLAIFLPFLFVGVIAHSIESRSCQKIKPVENFNSTKFLGTWYEYARYPVYLPGTCRSIDLTENLNGTNKIVMQHRTVGIEPPRWQVKVANLKLEGPSYTFTYPVDEPTFNKTCTIMSTDYVSYFVKGSCETTGRISVTYYWIMTRSRHPSQLVIDKINQACKDHGLPEPNFYKMVHKNCLPAP